MLSEECKDNRFNRVDNYIFIITHTSVYERTGEIEKEVFLVL